MANRKTDMTNHVPNSKDTSSSVISNVDYCIPQVLRKDKILYTMEPAPVFNNKTVEIYLDSICKDLLVANKISGYMITCTFDTSISFSNAWNKIQEYRDSIDKAISTSMETDFIISTIEHHCDTRAHAKILLYHSNTEIDLINTYNKLCCDGSVPATLYDIDCHLYTINLLNFFQEIYYLSRQKQVAEDYRKKLYSIIQELTPLVDNGQHYPFGFTEYKGVKTYNVDFYLGIAYYQMINKPVLLGYPHLHIAVGVPASIDRIAVEKELSRLVLSVTPFKDVKSERRKNTKGKKTAKADIQADIQESIADSDIRTGAIKYVLKNHAARMVVEMLKLQNQSLDIIKTLITSKRIGKELCEVFNHICHQEDTNNMTVNVKCKYNKSIYMTMSITQESLTAHRERETNKCLKKKLLDESLVTDPEESKGSRYVHVIQQAMAFYNLACCEGKIFQKIDGSKTSYNYYCDPLNLINSLPCEYNDSGIHGYIKNNILPMLETPDYVNRKREMGQKTFDFPRIKINYRMIEFRDCYFSINTGIIYKEQNRYYTYMYVPRITHSNLINSLVMFLQHSRWLKQLKMSKVYHPDNLSKLYELALPRDVKSLITLLLGRSNTGKSRILLPFIQIYPESKVGILHHVDEFHLHDQAKNKLLVISEEGNRMLNIASKAGKARAASVLLLGGEKTTSAAKHGKIEVLDTSEFALGISANIELGDCYIDHEPTINRCYLIHTTPSLEENADTAKQINDEAAEVILFTSMFYMMTKNNLKHLPMIPMVDILDEIDYNRIECIDDYIEDRPCIKNVDPNFNPFIPPESRMCTDQNTVPFVSYHPLTDDNTIKILTDLLPTANPLSQKQIINAVSRTIKELEGLTFTF